MGLPARRVVAIFDGDESVHLRAGDLVVQPGTVHGWLNHGPEPCEIAFVLVGAAPVTVGDRALGDEGW